jgi:hypothetical protein
VLNAADFYTKKIVKMANVRFYVSGHNKEKRI